MVVLTVAALVVAVVALVVAIRATRRPAVPLPPGPAKAAPAPEPAKAAPEPAGAVSAPEPVKVQRGELGRLREEVRTLRLELADALRHLAVVRYDAFGTMGGHLSWSMALLDDHGDGVVLTAINGRTESRSYAKNVREFGSDAKLSPEEIEAIEYLKKESRA